MENVVTINTEGWTRREKQELASLTSEADALEAKAAKINELADARDKLNEAKAKTAAVGKRW